MRKEIWLFVLIICFRFANTAQELGNDCGTEQPSQQWEETFQKLISNYKANQTSKKSVVIIPVIFHIIHAGQAQGSYPNLSQAQIISQITVLNQDFNGAAYNSANYPANAFVDWAFNQALPSANLDQNGRVKIADLGIQFCLATKDTLGNTLPEPGIDRINYVTKNWQNPSTYTNQTSFKNYLDTSIKPQSIWDVTKYMNVWVTDKSPALTNAGVSSVPPFSTLSGIPNTTTKSTDGIWCYAKAIGSYQIFQSGFYANANVDGRTLTHEVGHYFGLRHIWGDGTCATDYCDDTPPAKSENLGSPSYPHNVGSCAALSNTPNGEMFMNFMDYTIGPAKYMFTTDQMTRVKTALINSPFRNQLGMHNLCVNGTLAAAENTAQTRVRIFTSSTGGNLCIKATNANVLATKIYSTTGKLLIEERSTVFSIEYLPKGIYIITVQTEDSVFKEKFFKE